MTRTTRIILLLSLPTLVVATLAGRPRDSSRESPDPESSDPEWSDEAAPAHGVHAVLPRVWDTLPGVLSVTEAQRLPGGWVVLDRRGGMLHLLSPEGSLRDTWAGEGEGPGELRFPAAMAVVADTVWVAAMTGTRLDGFTPDGGFVRRLRPELPCAPPFLDDAAAWGSEVVLAIRCPDPTGGAQALVAVDTETGASRILPWPGDAAPPTPGHMVRLVHTVEGVLAGSTDDPCLRAAGLGSPPARCLDPASRRPLPRSVRDSLQARLDRRGAIAGRDAAPTHYPFLVDAFETSAGILAVRPTGERTASLEPMERHARWQMEAPPGAMPFAGGDEVLLAEEVLAGVRVTRLRLPRPKP